MEHLSSSRSSSPQDLLIDPKQTDPPRHSGTSGRVRPTERDLPDGRVFYRGDVALPDIQIADRGASLRELIVGPERVPGLRLDRDWTSILTSDAGDVVPADPNAD